MSSYTQRIFRRYIDNVNIRTAFEIGSRDGLDALAIATEYKPERLICMECNPEALETVSENVKKSEVIELVAKAASDYDGRTKFYPVIQSRQWDGTEGRNIGASSLFKETGLYGERYTQTEIEVECVRVETLCCSLEIGLIDLVCMDVQGAALRVLDGFGAFINKTTFIITELEFMSIYKGQALAPDVIRFLTERDFDLIQVSMQGDAFGDFLFHRRTAGGTLWGRE